MKRDIHCGNFLPCFKYEESPKIWIFQIKIQIIKKRNIFINLYFCQTKTDTEFPELELFSKFAKKNISGGKNVRIFDEFRLILSEELFHPSIKMISLKKYKFFSNSCNNL